MVQVKQLLGVAWTWRKNVSENAEGKDEQLMLPWHDPIRTNGTAHFDKVQAAHLMMQIQHL